MKLLTPIKRLFSDTKEDLIISKKFKKNPLVGYLKLYRSQHKLIFSLYRGLILTFAAFLILVGLFTYNAIDSLSVPNWGIYLLTGIDGILLLGVVVGLRELGKFRKKSQAVLFQIGDHLENDLGRLEKWKSDLRDRKKDRQKKTKDHEGWDFQVCPDCNSKVEMLVTDCPNCDRHFEPRSPG